MNDNTTKPKEELKATDHEIASLKDNLNSKEEIINKKEDHCNKLRSALESSKIENELKVDRIKALEAEILTLKKDKLTWSSEMDDIMKENNELKKEVEDLKCKLDNNHSWNSDEDRIQHIKEQKTKMSRKFGE